MQIILASASPRRKELFSWLGLSFDIVAPEIDETVLAGETPEEYCSRLSQEKAQAVKNAYANALVIAADTVVVINDAILGKPAHADEACEHLKVLQDATHEVYTAYTVMGDSRSTTRAVRTRVTFARMTEDEILWYVSTGEPMDKAGSYALQGIGAIFVQSIEGSYTNVIGLPLSHLYQDLKGFGIAL